jgi:adenylate cyclase
MRISFEITFHSRNSTIGTGFMRISYTLPPNPPKHFETASSSITFGRKPKADHDVDVDLSPDRYVSHVHARLTYEDGEYWIEDLSSENGTWVNDRRIQEKIRLPYGSKIRLGWTIIDIEIKTQVSDTQDKRIPPSEKTIIIQGTAAQPISEKPSEPIPEGTITSVKDALTPPFTEFEGEKIDESQKQTWQQLKALNNFIQALGTTPSIEGLGQLLVEQLRHAVPNAQRGALLLPDESGKPLLKAHWPPGKHSVSMTFVERALHKREAFIWTSSQPSETTDNGDTPQSAIYYDVQSAIYLPLLSGLDVLGVMYVDNYVLREAFSLTDFELLRAIANQVAMFLKDSVLRKDLQREEKLRSNLLRQYSPKIADSILKKCGHLQRGGEDIDPVTILVSDVRGFTMLSAKMEPDEVVRAINEMFDAFVPIISDLDGIIDKYVGDSVLAVFGSPEHDPDQWEKAVLAAVRMQEAMRMLGEGRKIRRLHPFNVGIGIHTGKVIHGFIGSSERIEFTVIGDTVNRAARYCQGAGPDQIVISKKVYERVYDLVKVDPVTIVTKHPDKEPNMEGYLVKSLRGKGDIFSWDQES